MEKTDTEFSVTERGKYRGFSSSIGSLFHHPQDCCSFVWCGIFQSDYNYYLFHRRRRSAFRIMFSYIFVPVVILFSVALCANFIDDEDQRDLSIFALLLTFFIYFGVQCTLGLISRVRFRTDLSNRVIQTAQDSGLSSYDHVHQNCCDATCANMLIYLRDDYEDSPSNEEHDFCTRLWQCFECVCCGSICGCWCQLFGACAIAQEGREVRGLVGEDKTQIDYITFEPYRNYYPKILQLRNERNSNIFWHIGRLSKLSKALLKLLLFSVLGFSVLALVELIEEAFPFNFQDMGVFILTFLQAFLILYFVHWKWNRFDLSFDAVVKYFASGFLLCTYLAFLFESLVSMTFKFFFSIFTVMIIGVGASESTTEYDDKLDDMYATDETGMAKDHPGLAILYYFFSAFFVASLTEELSKYYGYLMVQHPDSIIDYKVDDDSLSKPLEFPIVIGEDKENTPDPSSLLDEPQNTNNETSTVKDESDRISSTLIVNESQNTTNNRTYTSIGAGITIAMVAVAMGFACCENLIYIFIYTQGTPSAEIQVLLARSIFPVHPLCAAIQSIGVCKRVLEKDTSYTLGHIILVPFLLHGLFDFSLMSISVIAASRGYDDDWVINLSFLAPVSLTMFGFIYYFAMSDLQLSRLYELDLAQERESGVV